MDSILDESLRNWIAMAMAVPRTERLSLRTTPQVKEYLRQIAEKKGYTTGRVAHLAVLFGLAALAKYWEEEDEGGTDDEL